MFDKKSRYAESKTYTVTDHRGRTVTVVVVPERTEEVSIGSHILKQGQRIDHLAAKYIEDPAGYWRICELNGQMLPEALTEASEIDIPGKRR